MHSLEIQIGADSSYAFMQKISLIPTNFDTVLVFTFNDITIVVFHFRNKNIAITKDAFYI